MKQYSTLFTTLYDEQKPPAGISIWDPHYSVFRFSERMDGELLFYDFAVIWDEDHDDRIFHVLEELHHRGLLAEGLVFSEHKGVLSVVGLGSDEVSRDFERTVQDYEDPWSLAVCSLKKSSAFCQGIDARWSLGFKKANRDNLHRFVDDELSKKANAIRLDVSSLTPSEVQKHLTRYVLRGS